MFASARKDLEEQLGAVRAEMARLAAEEQELTAALASLEPNASSSSAAPASGSASPNAKAAKPATRSAGSGRARRRRSASKPTAERILELRALLTDGAKSRDELAAALKVSPARVQQLLGELGSAVTSQPADNGRAKLWSIKGAGNGPSAAKSWAKRDRRQAKRSSAGRTRARKAAAAK